MGTLDSGSFNNSLEANSKHHSVVFDTHRVNIRRAIREGKDAWAVAIDMPSGKMYVGDHHGSMRERHNIPDDSYCMAIVKITGNFEDVELTFLADWRKPEKQQIEHGPVKDAIQEALRRDMLAKPEAGV